MPSECEQIRQEYEDLKSLKKEFDLEYEKAAKTGNLEKAKELKAILEQKREALREKIDLYHDWQSYKNGETILHYEGKWDDWRSHPKGVVIRRDNQLLLNGTELLYEGKGDGWGLHPKGVVIRRGNQFLLNGTELLYEGKWDGWVPHPKGIVIIKGNQFLLNGTELLYEVEWDDWKSHPKGVIIRKGNDWIFYNESRKS